MTKSTSPDSQKDDPTARFHAILDGDKEDEPARPPKPSRSILDRLPRAPKPASPPAGPPRQPPAARARDTRPPPEAGSGVKSRRERYTHAFWNVTSWISLLVDAILIAVVIILLFYVRRLNLKVNELMSLSSMPLETVSGLYKNFELMEKAHIVTQIPVSTTVPVRLDVCIRTGRHQPGSDHPGCQSDGANRRLEYYQCHDADRPAAQHRLAGQPGSVRPGGDDDPGFVERER